MLVQANIGLAVQSKKFSVSGDFLCNAVHFFKLIVRVGNYRRLTVNNMSPENKKY